jgi:putative Mg2+ transporter-C (MgtC) family protein
MNLLAGVWDRVAPLLGLDLLGGLLVAAVLGGLVGWDREKRGKPAGLRTNMLICVGAALVTDLSIRFPGFVANELVRADPARLAAQIVSGVGFLGAGTIIQARGSVTGLTTAATLWVVAAIGMAAGAGFLVEAVGSTALVLLVLYPLGKLEQHVARSRRGRNLRVVATRRNGLVQELAQVLESRGLVVETQSVDLEKDRLVVSFEVIGKEADFRAAREVLLEREDVTGLHFA